MQEASPGRIKRQVWGPSHKIAIFTPKDFREEAELELARLGLESFEAHDFGWEGMTRMSDIYRLNLQLSLASRLLIRLAQVRAGATEQLFRETRAFPWELWLPPSPGEPDIRVHLEKSLIRHEGAAREAIHDGIRARLGKTASFDPAAPVPRIYFRGSGGKGCLSLDSSGEHLHRRGYRLNPGPAPISEHLAAALLARLRRVLPDPAWVLDGMSGSGSFAIEAGLLFSGYPPGFMRSFAFQFWPSYRPQTFQYWRREPLYGEGSGRGRLPSIYSVDNDPKCIRALKDNLERAFQDHLHMDGALRPEILQRDFFSLSQEELGIHEKGWLILNPPYDLRLESEQNSLWRNIADTLSTRWKGAALILVPHLRILKDLERFPRLLPDLAFWHGGRRVSALVLDLGA